MRSRLKLLLFALALAGCKDRPALFPGVALADAPGKTAVLREGCDSDKCLYMYVAPWCGVCRGATPMLSAFRTWLVGRGIGSFVIVGNDREARCVEYAREFGPGTLLDPGSEVRLRGGVPQFIVTDRNGKELGRKAGVPFMLEDPIPEEAFIWLAAYFELIDPTTPEAQNAIAVINDALSQQR